MGHAYLTHAGLTNHHAEHWETLCGENRSRDLRATYCSSDQCARNSTNARGKLVSVGMEYLSKCPNCGSNRLFFDTVTPNQAKNFKIFHRSEKETIEYA